MIWMTVQDAADHAHLSARSINNVVADGSLHSHQRIPRAKRLIAEAAVDAWIRGEDEAAQARACGCVALRAVRSA